MIIPTYSQLKQLALKKGYKFFDNGEYNLNLIGIRNKDLQSNNFNDKFIVAYKVQGKEFVHVFDCTTDPGIFYRENPANVLGTGWMKPGQYSGLWKVGMHQGKYRALVQNRAVALYRDNDKDKLLELGNVEVGINGVNCHHASATGKSINVDKWSAACQVIADIKDFEKLMSLVDLALPIHGSTFTYTLYDEVDLV